MDRLPILTDHNGNFPWYFKIAQAELELGFSAFTSLKKARVLRIGDFINHESAEIAQMISADAMRALSSDAKSKGIIFKEDLRDGSTVSDKLTNGFFHWGQKPQLHDKYNPSQQGLADFDREKSPQGIIKTFGSPILPILLNTSRPNKDLARNLRRDYESRTSDIGSKQEDDEEFVHSQIIKYCRGHEETLRLPVTAIFNKQYKPLLRQCQAAGLHSTAMIAVKENAGSLRQKGFTARDVNDMIEAFRIVDPDLVVFMEEKARLTLKTRKKHALAMKKAPKDLAP